jgi:Polyketide cyclase / dehydrase and lipid transport
MASIDVSAEIDIAAAPADIAAVMFDPARDQEWMKAVTGVEIIDPALAPGARVLRRGAFLGREFSWVTEVEAVHFPPLLTMQVTDGPFAGTVSYQIQRAGTGSHVKIRNVGETTKLGFVPAVLITGPMKTALSGDLERLKAIVEKK